MKKYPKNLTKAGQKSTYSGDQKEKLEATIKKAASDIDDADEKIAALVASIAQDGKDFANYFANCN